MGRIAWLKEDEHINLLKYDLSFSTAKDVILNPITLKITNIENDFCYIGFDNELSSVLCVYAAKEDDIIRLLWARRASAKEKKAFYQHLEEI